MSDTKICRYCGNVIYSDEEYCSYCGKYLYKEHDNKDLFCSKCKEPVNTDDNFCQRCGAVFNIPSEDLYQNDFKHNMAGIPYHLGIFITSLVLCISITALNTIGKDTTLGGNFIFGSVVFIVLEILLYIYFLPSIIAIENNNKNAFFIYVCNLLLGITIIGWFVALMMAQQSKRKIN